MARLLSPVASVIRGSIAGITYTANQYHQIIMRQRTAPVQPNTPLQTAMRTAFVAANAAWESLTPAVRTAWDQYAKSATYQGPLGPYTVPGKQIFMAGYSLQSYMNSRGLIVPNFITTAPVTTGFLQIQNVGETTPVGPGTGVAVRIGADPVDDCIAYVQLSIPFDPTRERFKGPFVASTAKAVLIPDGTSTIVEFLGLTLGQAYFMRVKGVADAAAARTSPEWIVRMVAETVGP